MLHLKHCSPLQDIDIKQVKNFNKVMSVAVIFSYSSECFPEFDLNNDTMYRTFGDLTEVACKKLG